MAITTSCCRTYDLKGLTCLGGFKNQRRVYDWDGETLELDETQFEHGTLYEVEVETVSVPYVHSKSQACLVAQI